MQANVTGKELGMLLLATRRGFGFYEPKDAYVRMSFTDESEQQVNVELLRPTNIRGLSRATGKKKIEYIDWFTEKKYEFVEAMTSIQWPPVTERYYKIGNDSFVMDLEGRLVESIREKQ